MEWLWLLMLLPYPSLCMKECTAPLMLCHLSWSQGVAQEPYCAVLDKLSLFWIPFPKKTFWVSLAVFCWVEGLKLFALVLQMQCALGSLTCPCCVFPAGSEKLTASFLFLLFSLFCVVEQNPGPLQTLELKWKKKKNLVKALVGEDQVGL